MDTDDHVLAKPSAGFPRTPLRFFLHFAREYPYSFIFLFVAPLIQVFEAALLPYALKLLVETISEFNGPRDDLVDALAPSLWLLASTWITMVVVLRFQDRWQAYVIPQFEADMRLSMFSYAKRHSHDYFAKSLSGSITNKINDMVDSVRNLLWLFRMQVFPTIFIAAVTLSIMGTINVAMAGIILVWMVVNISLIYPLAKRAQAASRENAFARSALTGRLVDAFSNIASVRLFAHTDEEDPSVRRNQEAERDSFKELTLRLSNAKIASEIPTILLLVGMFALLIREFQTGSVSSGDFVFVFYASFNLAMFTWRMSIQMPNIMKGFGVIDQALSLINRPHDIQDAEDAADIAVTAGSVTFEDVSFRHEDQDNLFNGLSLSVRGGEKVGLVGPSGSGKSTVINLLLRFYDPESGRIIVDGQDISGVTQSSLRRSISVIPQDTALFHRSIMENIRYGRMDATDEEVRQAAWRACCHEFIQSIPGGYEAIVGEKGIKLSGGQRQRIAIARAILKDAPIIVLDEATSSLDTETEREVHASLEELFAGKTAIVIAHRLSTLEGMDRIIDLGAGQSGSFH